MASKAVNVFLNAYDNTASATSTAAANVASYADSVVASNQVAAGSFDQVAAAAEGGILSSLAAIAAASVPAVVGIAAIAAVAYLVYEAWKAIGSTVIEAIQQIVNGTFNWRQAFISAAEVIVTALAAIEGGIRNWGDLASYVGLSAAYEVIKFANVTEYYITQVIPAWLKWFAENWSDVFVTIYNYVSTVIKNMHENLVRFFTAVFEYLQGNGFNFEWKGLTDGFESTLKKLPQIAQREIGALEKQMGIDAGILGTKLADGVQDNINKRLGQFQSSFGGKGAGGLFDKVKDFASNFSFGGFGGFGGGRGGGQQVTAPEGESSRFLTGVSASSQERLALEQLELQKQMAEAAKADAEWKRRFEQFFKGDFTGIIRGFATNQASQIILTD